MSESVLPPQPDPRTGLSPAQPPTQPQAQAPEHVLVSFGDVSITQHWLVTRGGTVPLAGTQIFIADMTRVDRRIPTWAIVLAIIGFFFALLGLLFLLVHEDRRSGFVQITFTNGAFVYQTAEPAQADGGAQLYELQTRANYARGLIAHA